MITILWYICLSPWWPGDLCRGEISWRYGEWGGGSHGRAHGHGGSWTFPLHIWALLSGILAAAYIVGSRGSSPPPCPLCQDDHQVSLLHILKSHKLIYQCASHIKSECIFYTNITGPSQRSSVCHRKRLFWCLNLAKRYTLLVCQLLAVISKYHFSTGVWFSKFKQCSQHQPVSNSSSLQWRGETTQGLYSVENISSLPQCISSLIKFQWCF